MKTAFLFLLWGLGMTAAELKVDHVTAAGKDVHAMQRALEAVGILSEYGGPHANHATEMALTSFPDGSYLELIAIQPHPEPSALEGTPWHRCLVTDAGPCGWAVRPADLAAEAERLRKAGVSVTAAAKNGRRRPDGVQLDWETAQVGAGNGDFFPFLIRDFTPRDRRAYPSGKPTTANYSGVVKVVLSVKNLDAAIAQYERAYGIGAPRKQDDAEFGAHLAWFEGTPVVLAAPDGRKSWLAARLDQLGETPCAFILGSAKPLVAPGHVQTRNWFGKPVVWLSPDSLGWRLGVE